MTILDDLLSRDAHRIWSGAGAIRKLYDRDALMRLAAHLPEIRDSTKGIPLGGAYHPNSAHLDYAFRKLEHVQADRGCLCELYDMWSSPPEEAKAGRLRIDRTVSAPDNHVDFYECACVSCGGRYHVIERDYHYTWWGWCRI
jgi:hypothetical protein